MNFLNKLIYGGKRTWFVLLMIILLCPLSFSIAHADYQFTIPEDLVIVWVEKDGTVSISYDFIIRNTGQGIDYIDIGMPNNEFRLNNVSATIDGNPVSSNNISYVDTEQTGYSYGVTIDNTASPIPRNTQAEIYLEVQQIKNVLYLTEDLTDSREYVSFQFLPSYFSSDFTRGTTDLTVRLVLPSGMDENDPVYFQPQDWDGDQEPYKYFTADGEVVYEWQSSAANSYSPYIFGASFPRDILSAGVAIQSESEAQQIASSNGSGSGIFSFWPLALIAFFVYRMIKKSKNKTPIKTGSYLPPTIKAEGEGIKRGLTAVEASVLLEQPMDKVISMIVFSLVKKNAITVTQQNPLAIQEESPLPVGLYDYETGFIEAMRNEKDSKKKTAMKKAITALINSVSTKMKGFSLEETKTYYKSIIAQAWEQVKSAQTPELKGEKLDEIFGWAILDEDIEKQTESTFGGSPVFLPNWWWRMNPTYVRPAGVPSGQPVPSTSTSIPAPTTMPTLPGADFARSITDSARNVAEGAVGGIKDFTQRVTGATNPAPRKTGSSDRKSGSGRSGGASCACACACAGCACACAGGGGGR